MCLDDSKERINLNKYMFQQTYAIVSILWVQNTYIIVTIYGVWNVLMIL